jgi:hypothetical protein
MPSCFTQQAPRPVAGHGVADFSAGGNANADMIQIIWERPQNKPGMRPRPSSGPYTPKFFRTAQAHCFLPIVVLQQDYARE